MNILKHTLLAASAALLSISANAAAGDYYDVYLAGHGGSTGVMAIEIKGTDSDGNGILTFSELSGFYESYNYNYSGAFSLSDITSFGGYDVVDNAFITTATDGDVLLTTTVTGALKTSWLNTVNHQIVSVAGTVTINSSGDQVGTAIAARTITTAVPEPQSYVLLVAGLAVLGAVARKQRRAIRAAQAV